MALVRVTSAISHHPIMDYGFLCWAAKIYASPPPKTYVSERWCAVGKHICSFNYVLQICPNP